MTVGQIKTCATKEGKMLLSPSADVTCSAAASIKHDESSCTESIVLVQISRRQVYTGCGHCYSLVCNIYEKILVRKHKISY